MKNYTAQENGQSIVIVALALVGLLAMLGLIFDVSNAYAKRRIMQNAADAAAYAGARVLGEEKGQPGYSAYTVEQDVLSAINTFAAKNGSPSTVTGVFLRSGGTQTGSIIGTNGGVPSDAAGVGVTTKIGFPTFFLGVINVGFGNVGANAAAMTGWPSAPSSGMMPIGVPRCYVDNSYTHDEDLCGAGDQSTTSHVILGQGAQDPSGSESYRGIINLRTRYEDAAGKNPASGSCGDGDKQDAVRYIEAGGYNNECGKVNYNQYIDALTGNSNGNAGVDAYNPDATGSAYYNGQPMYPIGTEILVCVYPEGTIDNGTKALVDCIGFAAMKITGFGSNHMDAVFAGRFIQSGPICTGDCGCDDCDFERKAVQLIKWP